MTESHKYRIQRVQRQTRSNKKDENKNVNMPQIGKRKSERILSKNSTQNTAESNEQIKKLKMKQLCEFNHEKHNTLEQKRIGRQERYDLLKRKLEISTNDDNIEKKKMKKESQKKTAQTEHRYNTCNRHSQISKDRDGKKNELSQKTESVRGKQKRLIQIIPPNYSSSVEPEIDQMINSNDNCEQLVNRLDVEHN